MQVFVNLLRNALNAIESAVGPNRGALPARAARRAAVDRGDGGRQRPRHSGGCAAGYFRCLRDHAPGRRGTGLGLTVAEGIVTQHGGDHLRQQSVPKAGRAWKFRSQLPGVS